MHPERRQKALSVFGVVQYRKRSSRSESETAEGAVESIMDKSMHSVSVEAMSDAVDPAASSSKTSITNSIGELAAVANELKNDSALGEENSTHPKPEDEANAKETSRAFDLRFWRSGHLLVVETQNLSAESDRPELDNPEARHRLANNAIRAMLGADTTGATMYTHSWPEACIGDTADDAAASEWLHLFLKGQKAKEPDTKLWLMGEDGLELLLAEHGTPETLEGKRIESKQLDLEIYVTDSLGRMLIEPAFKAAAWKLLGSISS